MPNIESIGQAFEQKLQEMDPRVRDAAIAGLVALAGLYEERRAKANGRTWRQQADADIQSLITGARNLSGDAVSSLETAGNGLLDSVERVIGSRRGQLPQETTQTLPAPSVVPTADVPQSQAQAGKSGRLLFTTGGMNPKTLYTSDVSRVAKNAWDFLAPTNKPLPIWVKRDGTRVYPDDAWTGLRKAFIQTAAEDPTISRQELRQMRQRNRLQPPAA